MPRHRVGRLTKRNRKIGKRRDDLLRNVPHAFVISRGNVGRSISALQKDFRQVMEPNVASNLNNTRRNKVKDFMAVAGVLNVTHLVIFSQTSSGLYMKICRMPHGPTLTFKIESYAQIKDVMSSLKKQIDPMNCYLVGPCLMTNLQPEEGELHLQLSARMFLDMFPTISPNEAKVKFIKRCCLIHYDFDEGHFDFRHYSINILPRGISKPLKKINKRKLPDLSNFTDVSDFMLKSGMLSESEGEDDPSAQVTVPSKMARGKSHPQKSSIRLSEIGPRLTLKLMKIEEGLLDGATLYNNNVVKTDEEKLQLENKLRMKQRLKIKRKKEQEKNVLAKKMKKEEHKKKCLKGMAIVKGKDDNDSDWADVEDDDDAQYYREEVGEEPDADLFNEVHMTKKRKMKNDEPVKKKFKDYDHKKKNDAVYKKDKGLKNSKGKKSLKKRDKKKRRN